MTRRHKMLALALLSSAALTWWSAAREPQAPVAAVARPTPARVAAQAVATSDLLALQPRNVPARGADPFRVAGWLAVPTPPAAAPAIPTAPPVPELPFRLLGRYIDGERQAFFLQYGERNVVAHLGDVIDDTYQVASLEQGLLTFIHLPLEMRQTLAVGEMN
ncbi:hypothetical protein [Chitiniphilus shinanonensis]|uniref:hypothetical protein n=1 Tax=Chitiniphilus shinanonensis TaxID=553088 RepID=UPI00302F2CB6